MKTPGKTSLRFRAFCWNPTGTHSGPTETSEQPVTEGKINYSSAPNGRDFLTWLTRSQKKPRPTRKPNNTTQHNKGNLPSYLEKKFFPKIVSWSALLVHTQGTSLIKRCYSKFLTLAFGREQSTAGEAHPKRVKSQFCLALTRCPFLHLVLIYRKVMNRQESSILLFEIHQAPKAQP